MAGTEDKAVAVEPAGLGGIVAQGLAEEDCADLRAPERQPEVARLAGDHGIHGEAA